MRILEMTLAGVLFALVVWGVALSAVYGKIPLRFSIPLLLLAGLLVAGSFHVVEDFEKWGSGLGTGLALAVAVFAGLDLRRRRSG